MYRDLCWERHSLQSAVTNCLQNASSLLDLALYFGLILDSPLNFRLFFLALLCHIQISVQLDTLTQLSLFGLFCLFGVLDAINLRVLEAFYL